MWMYAALHSRLSSLFRLIETAQGLEKAYFGLMFERTNHILKHFLLFRGKKKKALKVNYIEHSYDLFM